jgi:hypothetical protein
LKVVHLIVYSGNGVVFDEDRASSHAKGYDNGHVGGEAGDQSNTQGPNEFTKKVNTTHLRI